MEKSAITIELAVLLFIIVFICISLHFREMRVLQTIITNQDKILAIVTVLEDSKPMSKQIKERIDKITKKPIFDED